MPRTARIVCPAFALGLLLLAACGPKDRPAADARSPVGPWVLDVEALARRLDRTVPEGGVELRLLEGGRFEGRMRGAALAPETVAGRWRWDGERFELEVETRAGRPSDEGTLVGTYDGRALRLAPEAASERLEMVFVRP